MMTRDYANWEALTYYGEGNPVLSPFEFLVIYIRKKEVKRLNELWLYLYYKK